MHFVCISCTEVPPFVYITCPLGFINRKQMFASLMRGKTNKKLPRELPRMHLSVRCDAHVLSLLVSPPFRLSFSLSFLSFSFLRANRCTRRVPTSCPSPVVYPLPRLAFNSASPRPPPLSTPYFSPATPPNPVTLLPRSLSFSPFLSLPLPPSTNNPLHPTPLSRGASCMHLLRQCTAGCFGTQRRRNSNFWMLLILFLSERRERWCVCDAFRTR